MRRRVSVDHEGSVALRGFGVDVAHLLDAANAVARVREGFA